MPINPKDYADHAIVVHHHEREGSVILYPGYPSHTDGSHVLLVDKASSQSAESIAQALHDFITNLIINVANDCISVVKDATVTDSSNETRDNISAAIRSRFEM
jgi:hypothetical protein